MVILLILPKESKDNKYYFWRWYVLYPPYCGTWCLCLAISQESIWEHLWQHVENGFWGSASWGPIDLIHVHNMLWCQSHGCLLDMGLELVSRPQVKVCAMGHQKASCCIIPGALWKNISKPPWYTYHHNQVKFCWFKHRIFTFPSQGWIGVPKSGAEQH